MCNKPKPTTHKSKQREVHISARETRLLTPSTPSADPIADSRNKSGKTNLITKHIDAMRSEINTTDGVPSYKNK